MNQVVDGYARLSARQLEDLTHSEAPWMEARKGVPAGNHGEAIITKESMRLFYKRHIYGEKDESV